MFQGVSLLDTLTSASCDAALQSGTRETVKELPVEFW